MSEPFNLRAFEQAALHVRRQLVQEGLRSKKTPATPFRSSYMDSKAKLLRYVYQKKFWLRIELWQEP